MPNKILNKAVYIDRNDEIFFLRSWIITSRYSLVKFITIVPNINNLAVIHPNS